MAEKREQVVVAAEVAERDEEGDIEVVLGPGGRHVVVEEKDVHPLKLILFVKYPRGTKVVTPTGRVATAGSCRIMRSVYADNGVQIAEYDEEELQPAHGLSLDEARKALEGRLEFDDDGQTEVTVKAGLVLSKLDELDKVKG